MKLEVKQLSECPEQLTAVGTWIHEQWWSKRHNTTDAIFSQLRTHRIKDKVPYTIVAIADDIPVGSCCVIENDCLHRPQYSPWVAAVYVKPEMRNRGIASMMLQEAAVVASRINVGGLYIDCLATTARVYERNGWRIYEREVGDKHSVVMLRETD